MSDVLSENTEVQTTDDEGTGRRAFLRAAVAGVAGAAALTAVGEAVAREPAKGKVAPRKAAVQAELTEAERAKDAKRVQVESLLRELGAQGVEIQWVKGNVPGTRRIIQLKG